MNGYELAQMLRTKVTMALALQAADKLEELENLVYVKLASAPKEKTGKKNESKPSGNKDKTSFYAQREAANSVGLAGDLPRTESQSNIDEPLLSDAGTMGD